MLASRFRDAFGRHSQTTFLPGGALLLLVLVVTIYWPAQRCGWIWDDDDYVVANPVLNDLHGLQDIWLKPGATPQYYPLVHTTFWFEKHLWGLHPRGFHLVNVLLHAANCIVLWLLLRRLGLRGAWFAAILFAVHPVYVESVAWITERKNVLSGFFYLLSAFVYLARAPNASRLGWARWMISFGLYICALLSKSVTCTLPAALLLIEWWQRKRITRFDVLRLLPFFAVGIVMAFVTGWMERWRVGAKGAQFDLSMAQRFAIAGHAIWFYALKLCWPHPLIFIYPRWQIPRGGGSQLIFPLAALLVIGALWAARKGISKGPLVSVLFFIGTLFPALGFVNVYPMRYSFVADHFQYLASIGLLILVAEATARLAANRAPVLQAGIAALVLACIAAMITLTWRRQKAFTNLDSIWRDTVSKNPTSTVALTSLAGADYAAGRTDESIALYHRALASSPDDDVANYNLGHILGLQGQLSDAETVLRKSVEVSPDCVHCQYTLAVTLAQENKLEEALPHFAEAVRLGTSEPFVNYNYGVTLDQLGRDAQGAVQLKKAVELNPDLFEAQMELGDSLMRQRQVEAALPHFRKAAQLKPDDPGIQQRMQVLQHVQHP